MPDLQAADLDLLLRMFVLLSSAASTCTEREQCASRAFSYAVAMLHGSLVLVQDQPTAGLAPCSRHAAPGHSWATHTGCNGNMS